MKYCICKIELQNSIFQPSEPLKFENSFPGPTMVVGGETRVLPLGGCETQLPDKTALLIKFEGACHV